MADVEKDIVLRVKSETDQATGQFKNLKQELRSIENELNKMAEAGQSGTEAFRKLQQRAGEVKDQVGDTKAAIKALSSDTFRLDAFAQGAQAIAGGFASAQGALALFGTENKQVEEAIKKTQGAMALLQGVTAITNVLQKESALRLAIATTAQTAYTAVVGTSTGAMKLFRLALASTGIGALVVGLGLLISNFDDVKKVVMNLLKPFDGIIAKVRDFLSVISFGLIDDSATAKTKDNAEKVVDAFNKTKDAMKESEKVIERQIELAKAQGKSTKEIYNLEKQLADLRIKNLQIEQSALQTKEKAGTATEEEKKRIKELTTEIADANNKRLILDANYKRAISEANKKHTEEIKKHRQEELKSYKELELTYIQQPELTSKLAEDSEKNIGRSMEALKGLSNEIKLNAELDQVSLQNKKDATNEWLKMSMDAFNLASDLLGKNTKAGKAFAVASTLIDTYFSAQKAYASQMTITSPDAPIRAAVAASIAIAQGLARVRAITKVQVSPNANNSPTNPNGGGGTVPQPSAMATTTPTIGSTQLQLDAQGNLQQQSVRTYVLETDISDKQKRSQRLQRTATLGK
jgi:hypothetical protein